MQKLVPLQKDVFEPWDMDGEGGIWDFQRVGDWGV